MNSRALTSCATIAVLAMRCYGADAAAADITAVEAAPNIFVFSAPDIGNLYVEGNSVAVIDDSDVLVFDTGARPSSARVVLGRIQQLTKKPVKRIVNSHWHPDHWSGNETYARAFPGLEIIATKATRDYMARTTQSMRYTLRKGVKAHQQSASAATAGAAERTALRNEEDFLAEFEQLQIALPNVTFDGHLTLRSTSRVFELMTLSGDATSVAIAYLPKEKVVLAGDVIIYPLPYTPNGYAISPWLQSLRSIRALDAAVVVPGHGPVMKDYAYLDLLIEVISLVTDQVQRALETGVLTADLPQAVRLGPVGARFRSLTAVSEADLADFTQQLVAKVAQESRDGAQFRP